MSMFGSSVRIDFNFHHYLTNQLDRYRTLNNARIGQLENTGRVVLPAEVYKIVYSAITKALPLQQLPTGSPNNSPTASAAPVEPDDSLAVLISQASADTANSFVDAKTKQVEESRESLNWAEKYWNIKINAVKAKELSYEVIVATK